MYDCTGVGTIHNYTELYCAAPTPGQVHLRPSDPHGAHEQGQERGDARATSLADVQRSLRAHKHFSVPKFFGPFK